MVVCTLRRVVFILGIQNYPKVSIDPLHLLKDRNNSSKCNQIAELLRYGWSRAGFD